MLSNLPRSKRRLLPLGLLGMALLFLAAVPAGLLLGAGGRGGGGRGGGGWGSPGGGGGGGHVGGWGGHNGGGGPPGGWQRTQNPNQPTQHHSEPSTNPTANELPSTPFNDGQRYKLEDFKGKVLLIFYFDPTQSGWDKELQDRIAWVKSLTGQPVKALAIVQGDMTGRSAHLDAGIPVYTDNLQVFGQMWGTRDEDFVCRLVDADGKVGDWDTPLNEFHDAVKNAKWQYKDDGYDKYLAAIVDLLEWNQYETAMKQLRPLRKDNNKVLAESAEKLYAAVKAQGQIWKRDADKMAVDKPVEAYDLYVRIAAVFVNDDLSAGAAESIKALKASKPVADELAARELLKNVTAGLPAATKAQIGQAIDALGQIIAKYPSTHAALRADAFHKALQGVQ